MRTWRQAAAEVAPPRRSTEVAGFRLRANLPVGVVSVNNVASAPSALAAQPAASASMNGGFALTGCGAQVDWSGGAGKLLWQAQPLASAIAGSCDARSTEHIYSSAASITTHAAR